MEGVSNKIKKEKVGRLFKGETNKEWKNNKSWN